MEMNTGFDLFISRRKTHITEPARLEAESDIETYIYQDMPHTVVLGQSYRLFISDRLFASVQVLAKRRYSRPPIVISKPAEGPLQVHLIKKYVTLH